MVVRLVAKVQADNMEPTVLYPVDGVDQERIALLTGIVQLVSAALQRSGPSTLGEFTPNFMKSERGVIGYCSMGSYLIICEGDNEEETGSALKAAYDGRDLSKMDFAQKDMKEVQQRSREMGDLWK